MGEPMIWESTDLTSITVGLTPGTYRAEKFTMIYKSPEGLISEQDWWRVMPL